MVPRQLGHRCTTGNFSSNEKARGASKTRGSCERHCADGERWARHGCKRAPSLLLSRARLPIISDGFAMTAAIANNRASRGASLAHLSLFLDCCMNAARLVVWFASLHASVHWRSSSVFASTEISIASRSSTDGRFCCRCSADATAGLSV